jgi:adenosylcobinamide-phosphate synthase
VVAPAAWWGCLYLVFNRYSTVLALVWDVTVLYLTLGFRQFSHHFTDIRDALEQGAKTAPASCWPLAACGRQ